MGFSLCLFPHSPVPPTRKADVMTETATEIIHLQERINDLESHVAHLERAQQEMSDQMAAQWDQIDRLTRTMELLHRKMTSLEPAHEVTKPPHY